jgi:hypothetical protein
MVDKKKLESAIERLADRIGKADGALQDMQSTQAVLNLAHAVETLTVTENSEKHPNNSRHL